MGEPAATVPIRVATLGAELGVHTTDVTKRITMAYAAGIGACDARYLDDARPGGVVAPPGFIVSLEWPVFEAPDYLAAIGRNSGTIFLAFVHGYQDSRFYRPIRPGDRLRTAGRLTSVRSTGAGTLVTCRLSTVSAMDGIPVAESWFGSMYRGTPLLGDEREIEVVPALRPDAGLTSAQPQAFELQIPVGLAHVYTECARIWNPIHTEREAALAQGLPDIILHGTCTWAMALQRLADHFRPDADLPLRRFAARFSRMVIPGRPVRLEFDPPRERNVAFIVRNADGEIALSHGIAELA